LDPDRSARANDQDESEAMLVLDDEEIEYVRMCMFPYHSEPEPCRHGVVTNAEDENGPRRGPLHSCKGALERLYLTNPFIDALFPKLKIQKPGYDMYSSILFIQVVLCLYIFVFYANMTGSHDTIGQQLAQNQFSGSMVIVLSIQIVLMILERVTYKNRSFVEESPADRASSASASGQDSKEDGSAGYRTSSLQRNKI